MTKRELLKIIDELREEGHDDDLILAAFYQFFSQDELSLDE